MLNKIKNIKSLVQSTDTVDEDNFNSYNDKFKQALEDNLNTSNALTVLYDVIKSNISNITKIKLIESFDKVLSLDLLKEDKTNTEDVSYINKMIEKRTEAKKNKNYELADSIRNELLEKGIILKDTREGTTYEVIK